MRRTVKQLLHEHDAQIIPTGIADNYRQRGLTAITLRYGRGDNFERGAKAREDYSMSLSRMHEGGDVVYHGRLTTPEEEDRLGFLFHTEDTPLDEDTLDAAVTAFLLDLVEQTNTEDEQWFVNPRFDNLRTAFDDYPHYIHPSSRPRNVSLYAPDGEEIYETPSRINGLDVMFHLQGYEQGDTIFEIGASPDSLSDDWRRAFEQVDVADVRFVDAGDRTEVVLDTAKIPTTPQDED